MSEMFDKSQMSETIDVPAGCVCLSTVHGPACETFSLFDIRPIHISYRLQMKLEAR